MKRIVTIKSPLIPFISSYNFPIILQFELIDIEWFRKQLNFFVYSNDLILKINDNFYSQVFKLSEIKQWKKNNYQTIKGLIRLYDKKIMHNIRRFAKGNYEAFSSLFNKQLWDFKYYALNSETQHLLKLFPFNLVDLSKVFEIIVNGIYPTITELENHDDPLGIQPKPKSKIFATAKKYEQLIPLFWYMNHDASICEFLDEETINKKLISKCLDTNFKFIFIFGLDTYDLRERHIYNSVLNDIFDNFLKKSNAKLLNPDSVFLFSDLNVYYGHNTHYLRIFYYNDNSILFHKDYSIEDLQNYRYGHLTIVVYSNENISEKILETIRNFEMRKCSFCIATMNIETKR
jgi:hypothetical protein